MGENTEDERVHCVEVWEKEVTSGDLKKIMGNYLFRIRRWSKQQKGRKFNNTNIDTFKGVSLSNTDSYKYLMPYRIVDSSINNYSSDPIRELYNQKLDYPFQIDQPIINGKRFFEYIEFYINELKELKKNDATKEILNLLDSYEGKHRTGDKYTKDLFENALFYYYDKFGNFELKQASKICFIWSYSMRLTMHSVQLASMDKKASKEESLFIDIKHATLPSDVTNKFLDIQGDIKATKVEGIKEKFKEMGYLN